MSFARQMKQTITYWAPSTTDVYGKKTYASPVALTGRWEEKQEIFRDKTGKDIMSKARIFLQQAVVIDGYLYLGTSAGSDPTTVSGAWEIQAVGRMPDLRALRNLYVAML
jgi:hypothetical protein